MENYPWEVFWLLLAAGLLGGAAVLPYAFTLNRQQLADSPLSLPQLAAANLLQALVLTALSAGAGLYFAGQVGLGAPVLEAALAGQPWWPLVRPWLLLATGLGAASAALIALLDWFVFRPLVPPALQARPDDMALWKRLLASLYGGINEEILTRLFAFSLIAWLLSRLWDTPDWVFWAANLGAALLFGLFHLPSVAALVALNRVVVLRTLLLNTLGGLAFGWLYWQFGLLAAMLAHFTADLVLHGLWPWTVRRFLYRPPAVLPPAAG